MFKRKNCFLQTSCVVYQFHFDLCGAKYTGFTLLKVLTPAPRRVMSAQSFCPCRQLLEICPELRCRKGEVSLLLAFSNLISKYGKCNQNYEHFLFCCFSVPPLENFVMNRVLGDYFETLMYKIFVSIDENTTIAEVS